MTKHVLTVFAMDEPGVLNRVASLFRRRGFNIESITIGHTDIPDRSRMTIVVSGTGNIVEQVRKQIEKLVEVIKIIDITREDHVTRELALIKVRCAPSETASILRIASASHANIVDISSDSVIVEVVGDHDDIDLAYKVLANFGIAEMARSGVVRIAEMARSGVVSMGRGDITTVSEKESAIERRHRRTRAVSRKWWKKEAVYPTL